MYSLGFCRTAHVLVFEIRVCSTAIACVACVQYVGNLPRLVLRVHVRSNIARVLLAISDLSLSSTVAVRFVTARFRTPALSHLILPSVARTLILGIVPRNCGTLPLTRNSLTSLSCTRTFSSLPTTNTPLACAVSHTVPIKMSHTPAEIVAQLPERFDKARESGDVLFFPSTISKHQAHGVEVCESYSH